MRIENEREYRISGAWLRRFEQSLEQLQRAPLGNEHPKLRQARLEALQSQIEDLREQMAQYEALRRREVRSVQVSSLEDLPEALIKARIAAGLTQEQLAKRLKLKKQQIQRYEATHYASASLERLIEIARALNVQIKAEVVFGR
ncbi:helix-turn-helix transcriptional regulator [Meiothermus taiwanensis]|jgi:ribosome-binding protein aMBF1 (putative translation factor)|uniref:Helix-turn-helix protein n=2 Tax=Meiothermus taiwanensis TaxID=172827 RepID=A0A399E4H1_9DEIN|nr:helix-turn-helix transcriptional regulator [Meiothermus taiwanensis]AWR87659.1 hypothetical protein Mtai_v1c24300 [Meiothermus taiwanensis WR-220]KIQ53756.1 hypothetical protein SY28_12230 [Meiothermus taiwanensis]KZK15648.1 hypothetical protein A3962_09235 [Meiothermus taiwanensis]RIH78776.1 Helix-turn-helix protein [Meiothermus taiwanensis]